MKIRSGFVSNSSASSFVLSLPKKKNKVTLAIELDLSEIGEFITSQKELDEKFMEEYNPNGDDNIDDLLISRKEYDRNDDLSKLYKKSCLELKEGRVLVFGTVSSDDNGISNMIYSSGFKKLLPKDGEIKILLEENE